MAKSLSGKTVCWLQLRADGHPASYRHLLGFLSELKGKNRGWLCPLGTKAHKEMREKEQTQLLDIPSHKRRLREKKDLLTAPRNTVGGGSSSAKQQSSKTRPMLNLKLQRRKFLRANGSQTKIWSGMEHVVTTASWRLWEVKAYKSNWESPSFFLFFFLFFLYPLPPIFSACLPPLSLCFGLTASELSWTWWCRPTTEQNTQM